MELLGAEGAAGSTTASIVKLNCIIDPVLIKRKLPVAKRVKRLI